MVVLPILLAHNERYLLMNKSISVMYDPMQCIINLSSRNLK